MRHLVLLSACAFSAIAQSTLYATGANAKGFVVGAKLRSSGVFHRTSSGEWKHLGFNHPFTAAIQAGAQPDVLYLAAGNGLIRLTEMGERWKILTGSDVTELRDVDVDYRTGAIYFTHTRGIAESTDEGVTWRNINGDLRRPYAESVRADRKKAGVLVAATEAGIFRSLNGGKHWEQSGAGGYPVLRVEQSPHEPCTWLASTELGGLFLSRDCAKTFESLPGRVGFDRSLSGLAWDPEYAHRIAVAGPDFGVAVSEDDGKSWTFRNEGLPNLDILSVVFGTGKPGQMFAGVHEGGVYTSSDSGKHWKFDGLPQVDITRLNVIQERAR